MNDAAETVAVEYPLIATEVLPGRGKLAALAIVDLDIGGAVLELQGVQIVRGPPGGLVCRMPPFRHPHDGRRLPGIVLPTELMTAIADEVLDAFVAAAT